MAAGLALNTATVEYHGNDDSSAGWAKASVIVRQSVLKITVNRELVRNEPVLSVNKIKGNQWSVLTDAGTYTVTRAKGCGCGG